MGKVSGNWITGAHSGRACSKEQIYTKVNKKTGACYSVKLCNPNTEWTEDQIAKRKLFGKISAAISAWVNTNNVATAANYADYQKVLKQFDRQSKYSTLRGMMYGKGMYTISADGTVAVDVNTSTASSGSSQSSGGQAGASDDSAGSTTTKYTVSLAASPAAGGTVTGAGSYDEGSTANISAVANSGYTFSQWSDGDTNASRSVTVNSDLDLTAVFTANSGDDSNIPIFQ